MSSKINQRVLKLLRQIAPNGITLQEIAANLHVSKKKISKILHSQLSDPTSKSLIYASIDDELKQDKKWFFRSQPEEPSLENIVDIKEALNDLRSLNNAEINDEREEEGDDEFPDSINYVSDFGNLKDLPDDYYSMEHNEGIFVYGDFWDEERGKREKFYYTGIVGLFRNHIVSSKISEWFSFGFDYDTDKSIDRTQLATPKERLEAREDIRLFSLLKELILLISQFTSLSKTSPMSYSYSSDNAADEIDKMAGWEYHLICVEKSIENLEQQLKAIDIVPDEEPNYYIFLNNQKSDVKDLVIIANDFANKSRGNKKELSLVYTELIEIQNQLDSINNDLFSASYEWETWAHFLDKAYLKITEIHIRLRKYHIKYFLQDGVAKEPAVDTETKVRLTRDIQYGQSGISYKILFGEYLKNGHNIILTDPYIAVTYQLRNLKDFLFTLYDVCRPTPDKPIKCRLVTLNSEEVPSQSFNAAERLAELKSLQFNFNKINISFDWEFKNRDEIHYREIIIDNKWRIFLDRGLDIYRSWETSDLPQDFENYQILRTCKKALIIYTKMDKENVKCL